MANETYDKTWTFQLLNEKYDQSYLKDSIDFKEK